MSLFECLLNRQTAYNGLLCSLIDLIDRHVTLRFRPGAIRFLDEINTEETMGKMAVTSLSAVAQVERERNLERTNEGRLAAKTNGVRFGCRPRINSRHVFKLCREGLGAIEFSRQLQIGRSIVYRILQKASVLHL